MNSSDRVHTSTADHVAEVTLTRADKHNGLDYPMFDAINEAIDEVGSDRSVRAVVLSGEGRSFCAGLDFASVLAEGRPIEESFVRRDGEIANEFQRVAYGWQELDPPVIAALQGNCLGGGCQIALAADLRIAAPDLRLSIMEVKWGLIPDMGITQTLPRLVGIDHAKELTWSGRILDAEEALALGLVTELTDDPHERARELAAEIADRSPDAIQRSKRLFERTWNAAPEEALALEEKLQRELLGSPNQLEAIRAAMSGEPAEYADPT
ncbi:MAG TPA: crotonase/enoyl-CoA hydratase family protein [Solirubrobacterales bacterium]|nr:crotonase/enoyl-CoA hydratase family protein [Solirubrobacterales bacterium]